MIVGRGYITITNTQGSANLIDWQSQWKEGSLPSGWYPYGTREQNGVVLLNNPFGIKDLMWKCVPALSTNVAGGYHSPYYSLKDGVSYRFTSFAYRESAVKGTIYHGCDDIDNLSGGANANPYFCYKALPAKSWFLFVGYIHPAKADSSWQMSESGIYDMTGKKIGSGTDYKLRDPLKPMRFRDTQVYSDNPEDVAYFYNPRLEVCDGNEPSIEQLLRLSTRSEIDGMKTVYDSEFSILKAQVSSKVESATFNELGARVGAAETNIQQQASAIALKAEKSEVTALGTRMSNAEQKITADAINMTVKSQTETIAQGKVDGLQIGGRNLAKYTNPIIRNKWQTNGVISDFLVTLISNTYTYSYFQHPEVSEAVKDEFITLSAKVNLEYTSGSGLYFIIYSGGKWNYISEFKESTNNEYKLFSATFKVILSGAIGFAFQFNKNSLNNASKAIISQIKFEKGNKPTDWTPAPEDVAADAQTKATAAENAAKEAAANDAEAKYTTKTEYSAQLQILNNEISQRVTKSIFDTAISDTQLLAKAMSRGLMLYGDPTFKKTYNSVNIYINNGGGNVSITREKTDDAPNDSGYCLKINVFDGDNLRLGGFYFGTLTKANRTMVCRFVAKIPEGQILLFTSNAYGTGTSSKWLTSNLGTGKWEEYAYYVKCGETGTFSSTFYFYLKRLDNQTYPITWYLAYATVFDLNASEVYTPLSVSESNKIQLEGLIASKVSQTNFDALGNRVGAAESEIAQIPSKISLGVTESKSYADDKVDGLQIGGTNLLLNSKVSKSGTSYNVGYWTANRDFIAAETLTITIKGDTPESKLFVIWFNSASIYGGAIPKTADGLYSKTITVPNGVTMGNIAVYLMGNQTAGDQWSIEWIKLESGNKATDWTPAPEDVASDATAKADAARIAAEAVAAAKAELAKTTAQAYADGKVTAEEQRAINDAQAKLNEAKADAQTKATAAENAAKEAAAADATTKVGSLKEDIIRTGIDIESKKITVTADTFRLKNNAGAEQAVFEGGMLRTALIKAEEIVTRTVICRDSEGNIVSAINKEGDGAFRLYYPDTGKVQMEFKATATNGLIASYRPDGYLNWKIGANAGFITNSIDSWEIIKLFATSLDGLGIQTMENLPGTNFYTFMAAAGSPLAAYKGLTMKYGYPTSTAPTGVTAEMKIPDGWYTHPGPPYVMMESFDENLPTRYARWLMRYANGYEVETRELILDIDPNGGVGWLE